jgi:mRNA-degrading endonuclease YafQ of YafQ-DinJ toxin-antitoxin module
MLAISTHPRFDRHYRKLPKNLKEAAKVKERIFREEPYHPSLRTHKLHGKETGSWAFWINQKYRIKFVFISDTHALFLDIGTHDVYE